MNRMGVLWGGLCLLYGFFFYLAYHQQWGFDFASYYTASRELVAGHHPYRTLLLSPDLWAGHYLPSNPNPPIALWLFYVGFSQFPADVALYLWIFVSTAAGIIGVYQTAQCAAPALWQKGHWKTLLWVYFAAFPVVINAVILQVGGILLCLLMLGYRAYLRRQDGWAAVWWGGLIAWKLFPALLCLYVAMQRRWQLLGCLLGVVVGLTLLPWYLGRVSYTAYIEYVHAITVGCQWFGVNWNLSLLGTLYRCCLGMIPIQPAPLYLMTGQVIAVKIGYLVLSGLCMMGWCAGFRHLDRQGEHRAFSVLVVLMLLLSPLGWLYYFPLLWLPLCCTLHDAMRSNGRLWGWFLSLGCFYAPMPVVLHQFETNWVGGTIESGGLLGLLYLTITMRTPVSEWQWREISDTVRYGICTLTLFSLSFVCMRGVFLWCLWQQQQS